MDARRSPGLGTSGGSAPTAEEEEDTAPAATVPGQDLQEGDPFLPQNSCGCLHTAYVKHKRKPEDGQEEDKNQYKNKKKQVEKNHRTSRPWWRLRAPPPLDAAPNERSVTSDGGRPPPSSAAHQRPFRNTEVHLKSNGKPATETLLKAPANNDAPGQDHLLEMVPLSSECQKDAVVFVGGDRNADRDHQSSSQGRETWDARIDFLLSIIGFAVDLANVWRFPYLCYRNGGGAFLIPYFLMLIFGALPLFYMELILGQYHRQGAISVWNICPLFKGAGYCAVLVAFYVSFYYNVIIGWSFYFMFSSISWELPWTHCNNTWNTVDCWDKSKNWSSANHSSAAMEYFEREMLELHKSSGVHDLGPPKWQLCLCVLLVYLLLYMSLLKGVRSSGKVVWITATMPYIVLSILLIRGLMLPGAANGILYFIRPEMGKLASTQVWVDAAVQVFYSVGAGFGVHLTFSSYNKFHNDCFKDCLLTTAINSATSLFSGLVIFTYLGYMAEYQNKEIKDVATEGPGLVFEVYPEAIATLPGSQFWAFIFFLMLITLGMDSTMGGLESVITGFKDEFHHLFAKHRYSREIFMAIIMLISFTISTVNLTEGGLYMLHWFDTYSAGVSLLCSALFEAIGIAWFYGIDRFSQDIKEMLGSKPSKYWRICWKFLSPFFLVAIIISATFFQQPLKYKKYEYPTWAEAVGWIFSMSAVVAIPVVAIIEFSQQKGQTCKEKFAKSITPQQEQPKVSTGQVSRFQVRHWLSI